MSADLLVAGSIALDSLQGGRYRDQLGGSASYFSLAASLLRPVRVVAPVGRDEARRVRATLERPGIDLGGMVTLDAPTYRWFASETAGGGNVELGSQDSIYDLWQPAPPPGFTGWAFCGSMRADRQLQAMQGLGEATLLCADAMRSYVDAAPDAAHQVLQAAHCYFGNEEELAALGCIEPERFRSRWGLRLLVVKQGPGGATVFTDRGSHHEPAILDYGVADTTGAGDCLAGAMLARWREKEGDPEALPEALRWGVAAATIGISQVGVAAIVRATRVDVEALATRMPG
ncbi:MAG: PfkB family carbohydrate kinase [Candidatus Dormibacteraceae bacterium]